MEIRFAAMGDIQLLVRLRVDFFKALGELADDETDLAKALEAYYTTQLRTGGFVACIAEADSEAAGAAFMSRVNHLPKPGNLNGQFWHITNVFVYPAYRRQGVADKLLDALMARGRSEGPCTFDLTATQQGKSIYERAGFTPLPDAMRRV